MSSSGGFSVSSVSLFFAIISVAAVYPSPTFADPLERLNQRPESLLSDVVSRLDELYYLAAVAPFKSYAAETSSAVELAGKLDEVFRYVGGRGGSRLSQLVKMATAVAERNQWTNDGYANERLVKYKRRLIDEVLKLGNVRRRDPAAADADGGSRQHDAESDGTDRRRGIGETTWSESASWTECRKDYSEFVEPITNALWNGIRGAVCEELGLPERLCDALIKPLPDKTMPAWGWKMIDAMAKIPSGILEGKLSWVGAYDMCEAHSVNYTYVNDSQAYEIRQFDGLYCRLDIAVSPDLSLPLQFGVCVPDSCNSQEVIRYITEDNQFLKLVLEVLQWNITFAYCGYDVDPDSDSGYQTTLALFIICLVIVILATIFDGCARKRLVRPTIQLMENTVITLAKDDKEKSCHRKELRELSRINGIRALSFCYIVWGQTYVWGPLYTESYLTANLVTALLTLPQKITFQFILNFHLAADSFLVISGILVTYGFLKKSRKVSGLIPVLKASLMFVVRRYWRFMPGLMLSIMLVACTYQYTAIGPLYPATDSDSENCKINWWVNLLMLNNIVKLHEQCFGHAWFVSLAFQLYIASLVVVIPLCLRPKLGYAALVLMYFAHIVCTALLSASYRYSNDFDTWYNGYFLAPWCRAGPFIIGLCYGILLHHKPAGMKLKPVHVAALWLIAVGSIVTLTTVSYDQFREGGERWSPIELAAFDTLSRSVWGLAVGWMVIACQWGYAGFVNDFLTWKLFLPISRLSYIGMVWHAPVAFGFVYVLRQLLFVNTYVMMYAGFANIIMTLLFALIISLLWDYPIGIRWRKAVQCRTWWEWIRSGRHPRSRINRLEKDWCLAVDQQSATHEQPSSEITDDQQSIAL